MKNKVFEAKKCLENLDLSKNSNYKVLVGFDGFLDTIWNPISGHAPNGEAIFFSEIEEFGKYIQSKAGKSGFIEMEKRAVKPGGNAFLFADALSTWDVNLCCVGAFGYPQVHEVFHTNKSNLEIISIATPGNCTALEFTDGKLLLGDNSDINRMDFGYLKKRVGIERLVKLVEDADVLSLMNWSELQGSNDIWRGFLEEIFPYIKSNKKKLMFIDISDCSGRETKDILNMLKTIGKMSKYFEVVLSLNTNELQQIKKALKTLNNQDLFNKSADVSMEKQLYEMCNLKYLFIHMRDGAKGMDKKREIFVSNLLIEKPKISTGGGDNFNAGLMYCLLHEMDMESAMIIANAASGYYIKNGYGATRDQLFLYLEEWKEKLYS